MSRRNNSRVNNNFKLNNNLKFGIPTLIIFTSIGYIYRKELNKHINLISEWYFSTLKSNIENNKTDIIKSYYERMHYANKFFKENKEFFTGVSSTLILNNKFIKKTLPKAYKTLLKFIKK